MIAGRYSLGREIGRGGMSAVWLGRDEVLGRQVALKRIGLLPGTDGTDLARAEREARLAARLSHPHVVSVFNYLVDDDSDARWLVMEYVEGTTLAELVRERGSLSPEEAAPLLWQAADALAAAHGAGIVHRDVKPSNILVDPDGVAKLTDFGIARISADPSLTQTGLILGSPSYLAPEVAAGNGGDEAVDVWSLGATLYFALSGRPPFEPGDNVLSTLYRIVNDDPPPLAGAGRLAPLLDGTLVKDPSRRWSIDRVRDFLADPPDLAQPVRGTRPMPVAPAPKRRPRRGAILVAASLVVLALVLVPVLHAVLSDRGPDAKGSAGSGQASTGTASRPTARGMERFIHDYVTTVSSDPDRAWQMLTPKFQQESGGLDTYRAFWTPARNGRVLSISADPGSLSVSYHVLFDHFHNGPGPTVLDLAFDHGHYLIDGEHTKGFVPAG